MDQGFIGDHASSKGLPKAEAVNQSDDHEGSSEESSEIDSDDEVAVGMQRAKND